MSRFDELKKQYPELNITILDVLKRLDKSNSYKYLPLLCKIFGKRYKIDDVSKFDLESNQDKIMEIIASLNKKEVNHIGLNNNEKFVIYSIMSDYFSPEHIYTMNRFMEYMEKNKIEKKDVSSYSTIEDVRCSVNLATLKEMNKELEGQIIREFENDEWIILRPLTFQSSAKYGSGTRWCTTYAEQKEYFEKYWRRGILVYFINKKTGLKVAGFKSLDGESELSFWNAEDSRIDFLDADFDDYLFPVIKTIFKSVNTNKNLCTDEIQKTVHDECIPREEKLYFINRTLTDNELIQINYTHPGEEVNQQPQAIAIS